MSVALRFAARSDLGLGSKSRNEDSAYVSPDMLVLADGMGGHAAGDTASSTVVRELMQLDGQSYTAEEAMSRLRATVERANERLRDEMDNTPDTEGMGTTLIAFLRSGNKLALANIGDSRAYLVRDGVFSQITKDHSFVQALLDEGRISPDEAEHHPQRSLVTRVLTGREDDAPDMSLREARVGDRLLLCSDGLSDYVAGSTIESIMTSAGSPEELADQLIAIALRASTRDNVTVVVAEVVSAERSNPTRPQLVGAVAAREPQRPTPDSATTGPQNTPAEKAAALYREANPAPGATAVDPNGDHPNQNLPGQPHGSQDGPPLLAEEKPGRRFGRWHVLGILGVLVLVLAVAGYVGYDWTQRQYYVGTSQGKVVIYRGVSQDLGPISLHSVRQKTDIEVNNLPSFYRSRVGSTMNADGLADARRIVADLKAQADKCVAAGKGTCKS